MRSRGVVDIGNGQRAFRGNLFDLTEFDRDSGVFTKLDLAVTGFRTRRGTFKSRNSNDGPARVGCAIALETRP